jgi:hypothetical protein
MRNCPICIGSQRSAIEVAIANGSRLQGIAECYGLHVKDLRSHQRRCTPALKPVYAAAASQVEARP